MHTNSPAAASSQHYSFTGGVRPAIYRHALQAAGLVYRPTSETYEDSGEVPHPAAYAAAAVAAGTGTRGLEFGPTLGASIDWATGNLYAYALEDGVEIENIYALAPIDVARRVAAFVAGTYWADAAVATVLAS